MEKGHFNLVLVSVAALKLLIPLFPLLFMWCGKLESSITNTVGMCVASIDGILEYFGIAF